MAGPCIKGEAAARQLGEQIKYDFRTKGSKNVEVCNTEQGGISVFADDHISYRSFIVSPEGDLSVTRSGNGLNGTSSRTGVFTPDAVARARAFIQKKVSETE